MNWYQISITFRWPHQGIILGYEVMTPDEEDDYTTIRIHLTLISLSIDYA